MRVASEKRLQRQNEHPNDHGKKNMMSGIKKLTRISTDGKTEYQIEYTLRASDASYRIRRGSLGVWAQWFKTNDMRDMLISCGFSTKKGPNLLSDFYCDSHFGRGTIKLTEKMARFIAKEAVRTTIGRHVYSRLKKIDECTWGLPTRVLSSDTVFDWVHGVIKQNLK